MFTRLLKLPLYFQVLIAIFLAIIFGCLAPESAQKMRPLGDGFIKLIKMCIAPIIFCTIVNGMTNDMDLKKLGKLGLKTLIYFELMSGFALIIGLVVALVLKPGNGMNIDVATLDASVLEKYVKDVPAQAPSTSEFVLNIIPETIFSAFVTGDILSVLFVAFVFGFALSAIRTHVTSVINGIGEFSKIMSQIIAGIIKFAPLGAFGAMSYTVGKYGFSSLFPLLELMGTFYLTCFLFIILVMGLMMKLCGSNIFKLMAHIKDEIFLVLGTSSSESALPSLIKKMETFGCEKSVVGFVVPAGYSFNLDGSCIYFTMALIFITQALNIDLTLVQILTIFLILTVTSNGAAGVAGSGFVTLAATLSVIDSIPLAGLVLILGIDRFMSEARAITNFIGNAAATVVVSKLEGKFKSQ